MHALLLFIASSALVTAVERPVPSLFPLTTADTSPEPVTNHLFESLLERSPEDCSWQPLLASSWSVAPDLLTLTFSLDPKAKFWDGSPVTAEDVRFSWAVMDLDGVDAEPWVTHFLMIKSVEAVQRDKVKVTLHKAHYPAFAAFAAMRIFQKAHYENLYAKDRTLRGEASIKDPMGSGPWRVESWSAKETVLTRNEDYWQRQKFDKEGRFALTRRIVRHISGGDAQIAALKKGEISALTLTKEQWSREVEKSDWPKSVVAVKAEDKIPKAYDFIAWSEWHPALKTSRERQALSHLVDLGKWIKDFDGGMTEPALGPYDPKGSGHHSEVKVVAFSPSTAQKLLKAAGWRPGKNGILKKENVTFDLEVIYPENAPGRYSDKLSLLAGEARRIGILLKPKAVSWGDMQKKLVAHDYGGAVMSMTRSEDMSVRRQFHKSMLKDGDNFVGFVNERASKLIEELDATFDAKTRREIAQDLDLHIVKSAVYTFLTQYKFTLYARHEKISVPRPSFPFSIGIPYWNIVN